MSSSNPPPTLSVAIAREGTSAAIVVMASGAAPSLSTLLPALHNMGLQVSHQTTHRTAPAAPSGCALWLQPDSVALLPPAAQEATLCDILARIFSGEAEDGRLNGLALAAGCSAHDVLLVRAALSYLRQAGVHMSLRYMAERLRRYPAALRGWLALFAARFDPAVADREAAMARADGRLAALQSDIADADAFELIGRLRELAWGMVRTTHFRADPRGPLPAYVAFKVDGQALSFLPAPRPYRETFVFSERFEGVHLRGGPVSRGGLRWSDRQEDYRTEVLGLVKAQLVKNAVIVPTGAKGGFVCKRADDDGAAVYALFINGLLDLTDNQAPGGAIVPPPGVVCHDGPDPYLVVAADKGTARFSDLANRIALERGFWLGDAFASGGSVGYDHKQLGITAKGAWETAKIRFSELGIDADGAGFSAVGIGDMGGDVFGNGMLLMPRLRLLAAFDHRHVFLDPRPDVQRAYGERRRLFALPRSSWDDYDRALLSAGGGIWPRTERSITLSREVRECLGIDAAELSPDQLIAAILRAPVDVLYNGGIGTYVKAAHESADSVRDRANDRVRIDAQQVRARVVVEGGNLGLTAAARTELALHGVQVYTDAVDNSGGVDCSDHEVNIKIALALEPRPETERAALLAAMAPEVEARVLATNRNQARRLARHVRQPALIGDAAALMARLGELTGLDRALEALPDDATLARRPQRALAAPELAVLMAHDKRALKEAWLAAGSAASRAASSAAPTPPLAPWHEAVLRHYFPAPLQKLPLQQHPLARPIVATVLANAAVDRLGIGVVSAADRGGMPATLDALAFGLTALRLDSAALGDAAIAALPADERHAAEAALEQALQHLLQHLLAEPRLLQAATWQALREACAGTPPSSAAACVAEVQRRTRLVADLRRALPLLERGHAVAAVLSAMGEVERETSLARLAAELCAQPELATQGLFRQCIERRFSLLALRIAAMALARPAQQAVAEALDRLGWREALQRLRVVHANEWGERRLERMLDIAARLDEQRALEAGVADAVA
jgi:glutamate dehydrogenase